MILLCVSAIFRQSATLCFLMISKNARFHYIMLENCTFCEPLLKAEHRIGILYLTEPTKPMLLGVSVTWWVFVCLEGKRNAE